MRRLPRTPLVAVAIAAAVAVLPAAAEEPALALDLEDAAAA